MKKIVNFILIFCMVLTMCLTVSANDGYVVIADGKAVDFGKNSVYILDNHIMVPVREVAESLGFNVEWDEEHEGVKLDDKTVNTIIYIGEDNYYMASSFAIGMSAPTKLGVAPCLKNSKTYVPVELFNILYCDENAVKIDGKIITINSNAEENTQIPSPFTYYDTISDAKKALSFDAKIPGKIPADYKLDNVSTIGSDDFLQIVYVNGSDEITYRTAKDGGDISGDYNVYKNKKDIKIGSYDAQIRGNDGVCSVIWTDGEFSFSLYSSKEFSEKEMLDVISDILK